MKKLSCNDLLTALCRGISFVLHPLLMPLWLLWVLFAIGAMPPAMPPAVRRFIWLAVASGTFCFPVVVFCLMKLLRLIPNLSFATRRERFLPMLVLAVGYLICYWGLNVLPILYLLRRMLLVALCCMAIDFVVTMFWQVSLHATSMGAAVGLALLLLLAGYDVVWLFCCAVLGAGALASARLFLGRHTPQQVHAGFAIGFVTSVTLMLL